MSSSRRKRGSQNFIFYRPNGARFYSGIYSANEFLKEKSYSLLSDIYKIGIGVFELERQIKSGEDVRKIVIPVHRKTLNKINSTEVERSLNELANFVLRKNIEFKLEGKSFDVIEDATEFPDIECNAVTLFSGGVDSYIGVLKSKELFKKISAVYVHHKDYKRLGSIINKLKDPLLSKHNVQLNNISAPTHGQGYSQTRGMLYVLCGSIFAEIYGTDKIVVSECGNTMYQPRFGPFDEITYTTNPFVLDRAKEIIENFLNKKIELVKPFENSTKAEMVAMCPEKKGLTLTHSCIMTKYGKNMGECYGCIIRKLAFTVAGVTDCQYQYDIFEMSEESSLKWLGKNARVKHYTEAVLALMRFSFDILKDYKNMPYYSKENIETYGKYDLFRRFALDNLAGLYLICEKEKQGKNTVIKDAFKDVREFVSTEELENRITEVRKLKV